MDASSVGFLPDVGRPFHSEILHLSGAWLLLLQRHKYCSVITILLASTRDRYDGCRETQLADRFPFEQDIFDRIC